jgi:hypothetical protein
VIAISITSLVLVVIIAWLFLGFLALMLLHDLDRHEDEMDLAWRERYFRERDK